MNACLKIESNDIDICGKWTADEVEAELTNLEIPLENEKTWLKWVLERDLEDYNIDIDALVAVLYAGDIMSSVTVNFNDVYIDFEILRWK